MKHFKGSYIVIALGLIASLNTLAKDMTPEDISVVYDSSKVELNCPENALGCFKSTNGGEIFMRTDIKKEYTDVVKFGLYNDYMQYWSSKSIDPIKTCELQVDFLYDRKQAAIAEKYSDYCKQLKQNLFALK